MKIMWLTILPEKSAEAVHEKLNVITFSSSNLK